MNRTDGGWRARKKTRARALNASPLNYSDGPRTHGNRRTVKSMNPAMEFAPRRREALSSRRRESVRAFSVPAFPSYPPWRIILGENWSFRGPSARLGWLELYKNEEFLESGTLLARVVITCFFSSPLVSRLSGASLIHFWRIKFEDLWICGKANIFPFSAILLFRRRIIRTRY